MAWCRYCEQQYEPVAGHSCPQAAIGNVPPALPAPVLTKQLLRDAQAFVSKSRCSVGHSVSEVRDRAKAKTCIYCEHQFSLYEALGAEIARLADEPKATPVYPFVVKHYESDKRPIIKGNGFDGLEIGSSRDEAQEFIDWVNARLPVRTDVPTCGHVGTQTVLACISCGVVVETPDGITAAGQAALRTDEPSHKQPGLTQAERIEAQRKALDELK